MSTQKIVTIENSTYIINPFRGVKGLRLLQRVSKHLLPLWTAYLASDGESMVADAEFISQLQDLLLKDDSDSLSQLLLDLVEDVEVNGSKIDPDKEFECAYERIFTLAFHVLQVNYYGTFQKLATSLMT